MSQKIKGFMYTVVEGGRFNIGLTWCICDEKVKRCLSKLNYVCLSVHI